MSDATTFLSIGDGNDSNDGSTPALGKATSASAMSGWSGGNNRLIILCRDPSGQATLRETITPPSGTSGNPNWIIYDCYGVYDGVGGRIRHSGSDDDDTTTRSTCIDLTGISHFNVRSSVPSLRFAPLFDGSSGTFILANGCDTIDIRFLDFSACVNEAVAWSASSGTNLTLYGCRMVSGAGLAYCGANSLVDSNIVIGCDKMAAANNNAGNTVFQNNLVIDCNYGVNLFSPISTANVARGNVLMRIGTYSFSGNAGGLLTEDYNLIMRSGPRNNVTAGSNSVSSTNGVLPYQFGAGDLAAFLFGSGSYQNGGGTLSSLLDILGRPRPGGAGTDWGPVQSGPGVFYATVSGEPVAMLGGRDVFDYEVEAKDGFTLDVDVDVQWDASGTLPKVELIHPDGTVLATDTATGSVDTWDTLSVSSGSDVSVYGGGNTTYKLRCYGQDNSIIATWRKPIASYV